MIRTADSIRRIVRSQSPSAESIAAAGIDPCRPNGPLPGEVWCELEVPTNEMSRAVRTGSTCEFLILRVLRREHADLRAELRQLQARAAAIADRHGSRHLELHVIRELVEELASKLVLHMNAEESTVFPALLDLELAYLGERYLPAASMRVGDLLESMAEEHRLAGQTLQRLCRETSGFCSPGNTGSESQEFYGRLRTLYSGLRHDLDVENNVLFPRVTQMEAELLRGTSLLH